jgi:CheY-like chemotaxis protein
MRSRDTHRRSPTGRGAGAAAERRAAVRAEDARRASGMVPALGPDGQPWLAKKTILLVDDHPDTREMFAEYLTYCGARPIVARDAEEAVTVLEGIRVDVLVTDVAMPREDGYQLLARLDANPAWRGIARIVASGQSAPADTERRAPSAIHLEKPVALEDLVSAIHRALGRSSDG